MGGFFYRISSKQIPRLMVADVLVVVAFQSTKEWLLDFDVGVFWVVMRVLACGGLGVLVWEVGTQQVAKRKDIEVIVSSSFALFSLGSLDLGTVSLRPLTPSPLAMMMIDEFFLLYYSGRQLRWLVCCCSFSSLVCLRRCIDYLLFGA